MNLTTAAVREWAELIVPQLGAPDGHSLTVTAAGPPGGPLQPLDSGEEFTSSSRVERDGRGERRGNASGDTDAAGDSGDSGDSGESGESGESGDPEGAGVVVTLAFSDGTSISVHLEQPLGEADAVVILADQLQDGVLEETAGAPRPPCPADGGHLHPAVARVVDGVASWVCPTGEGARRPILPPLRTA
jgi:hypothetical protein